MNKRDLIADLKICNKATSGPWLIADEPEVIIENTFSSPILFSAVAFEDDLGASKVEALKTEDLDFILQAREGWPHAIERALYAEELVRELVQELENVVCFIETMEYRHVSESVGKDFVGYKCGDGNSYWIGDILGDIEIMINKAKVAGCQHIFEDITSLSEATQGVERSICTQCGHEVLKYVSTKEVLGDE